MGRSHWNRRTAGKLSPRTLVKRIRGLPFKRGHSKNQKGPFTIRLDGKGPVPSFPVHAGGTCIRKSLTITREHGGVVATQQEITEMWTILIPITFTALLAFTVSALWGMQNLIDSPYDN